MIISVINVDIVSVFMKKSNNLNTILPDIQRCSDKKDEGAYYKELRLSPRITIISGGQSGVDSIGLEVASCLGLPTFAIMPQNCRREGESFESFVQRKKLQLRIITLGSYSYRFRTYANVYFSDFTIIYDFVNSEGTRATIDACIYFGRPYVLISEINQEKREKTVKKLLDSMPRVINIAGNSADKLCENEMDLIRSDLHKILKTYCFLSCANLKLINYKRANESFYRNKKIKVVIPNFAIAKEIFKDFIKREYGYNITYDKRLVYELPSFTLITVRPREIIRIVEKGADIGFVGKDLYYESMTKMPCLFETGLIPNAMVLVSKSEEKVFDKSKTVCSQYPVFAKKLLRCDKDIDQIAGSAEAFLNIKLYDYCVDTYQTGNTVKQNDLKIVKRLAETSLVSVGKKEIMNEEFVYKFLNYLTDLA